MYYSIVARCIVLKKNSVCTVHKSIVELFFFHTKATFLLITSSFLCNSMSCALNTPTANATQVDNLVHKYFMKFVFIREFSTPYELLFFELESSDR